MQEKVRGGINTKNKRERGECSTNPKRSVVIVQRVAGSQKRLRWAVGFHGTDFSRATPTKLKKKGPSSYILVNSQDLCPGLCFSCDFSVVGLKEQPEAK